MRNILKALLVLPLALVPAFGGGMILEIGNPGAHSGAAAKHGVVLAHVTACHNPAKAELTATAEGVVNGERRTLALKPDALLETGTWSIARAWPAEGKWVVRLVVTHPEYGSYASSLVVGVDGDSFDWGKVTRFAGKQPSSADITAILTK